MSFDRVLQYVQRNKEQTTFVCVKDGAARCIAVERSSKNEEKVNRILRGYYPSVKPVGFYTSDVSELDLAQDLRYCGVIT
jgi:hypothetical protein